jgi:hypothetical protein
MQTSLFKKMLEPSYYTASVDSNSMAGQVSHQVVKSSSLRQVMRAASRFNAAQPPEAPVSSSTACSIETENSTTKQTTMTTYRLYNYKTGHLYSDHPTLEGALLSAMFHVEKGQKVKWSGGPHVWFGHVDRQATPKFGVDVVKSETE